MTIFIDVDPSFEDSPDLPNFNDLIIAVFSDQKIPVESDVTIVIVDDDQIHKLNRVFLDEDKPTDVLAFPAGHVDPDTGHQNYGDIIISYPRAKNQADLAGHPLSSELSLLTIHGLLHLIGFNHDQPESEAEMWQVQSAVLKKMGVNIKPPDHSTQLNNQS
jgi:probable rRNA maturation factor